MLARLRPYLRRAGHVAGMIGVLLLVLTVRVVTASSTEFAEGTRLRERGDVDAAIAHLRRAARWYAPGNPYNARALDELTAIGVQAAAEGDPARALAAHRSVRAAILTSRSFYVPHAERLARADEAIATLMSEQPRPAIDATRSPAELREAHLTLLREVPRPRLVFALLALLGLAAWTTAAFAFVTRALDADDRLLPSPARLWGSVWIVGFGAFVLGLALA